MRRLQRKVRTFAEYMILNLEPHRTNKTDALN